MQSTVKEEQVSPLAVKLTGGEFASYTRHQVGVILTIVEASIPQGKQLEAVKSMIKNSIHRDATELETWCYGQIDGQGGTFPFWSEK
jgi:hypothetical protein